MKTLPASLWFTLHFLDSRTCAGTPTPRRGRRCPAQSHTGAVGGRAPDCAAMLGQRSRRGTHFANCVRAVRTTATSQITKRAARADRRPVLLATPEIARTGHRLPRRCIVGIRGSENQKRFRKGAWGQASARLLVRRGGAPRAQTVQWTVCAWRAVGPLARGGLQGQGLWPRAQRDSSSLSSRLSERRERSERSEFRDAAARPSSAGQSGVAPTAPVKRCGLSPRAFAAHPVGMDASAAPLFAADRKKTQQPAAPCMRGASSIARGTS